jgi:hypothetical protein
MGRHQVFGTFTLAGMFLTGEAKTCPKRRDEHGYIV